MILNTDLNISILTSCLERAIPFVAYRKPNDSKIRLMLSEKFESFYFHGQDVFNKQGFIVVPFDNEHYPSFLLEPNIDKYTDDFLSEDIAWLETHPKKSLILSSIEDNDSKENYKIAFNKIFAAISEKKISKAILSRCHFVKDVNALNAPDYFMHLCALQSSTYNYLLYIPEAGMWMGASPELFLNTNGQFVETVSLAGTMKREESLEWNEKDIKEQKIVTDYIAEQLQDFSVKSVQQEGPKTVFAGHVAHLKTIFRFSKQSIQAHLGNFVSALHPTPAVCGYPKLLSKQLILQTENHSRGLYAGFLGSIQADGQFTFYVNIRCMQFFSNGAGLYVGGGITAMSEPEAEYNETLLKAENLLKLTINN
jgi:isochorismate synthase